MSPLALRILDLFISHAKERNHNDTCWSSRYPGYIAAWTLSTSLGGDANTINGVAVKYPQNDYQRAMKELIDLGIVQEKPDLPERFELVVKEPQKEQAKLAEKPTLANYWTKEVEK